AFADTYDLEVVVREAVLAQPLYGPSLRTRLDPTRLQGQWHLDPVDVRQRALEQHLVHSGGGLEPEDAVRGAPQTLRRLPVHEDEEDEHERARGGRRQGERASRAQRATRHTGEEKARERDPQEGEDAVHARRGERQVEALIAFHRPAPAEGDRLPAPAREPGAGRNDRIRI